MTAKAYRAISLLFYPGKCANIYIQVNITTASGGYAMSVWAAILLGFIQGVAEFLPISSSGHLSVLQNLFNFQTAEEGHMFFDVLLHLATLVSVCVVYRADLAEMIRDVLAYLRGKSHPVPGGDKQRPALRLVLMIILATLPLIVILPIHDYIEQLYYNTWFIAVTFILTGILLYISDRLPVGKKTGKNMSAANALTVGVCQAVATIPGLSRSGTTITAGMAAGLDRSFAVKFSFLISIPAILGANILSLFKAVKAGIDMSLLPIYLLGMLVAMVTGYFSIHLVRMIAKKGRFGGFAYYCWGAGIVTIILSIILL